MPLPPDCSVASLAAWLRILDYPSANFTGIEMARAIRALLEAKCRAMFENVIDLWPEDDFIPGIATQEDLVSRVLGAP